MWLFMLRVSVIGQATDHVLCAGADPGVNNGFAVATKFAPN